MDEKCLLMITGKHEIWKSYNFEKMLCFNTRETNVLKINVYLSFINLIYIDLKLSVLIYFILFSKEMLQNIFSLINYSFKI